MIAIYARVSTEIQATEGTSLDSQVELCKNKALNMGFRESEIVVFREEGVSGEDIDRPAMNNLRDNISKGLFTHIICLHPDRLSRDLTDKLVVCKELQNLGVELLFVDTEYKNTPEGQLFFNMQSVIAQYELARIRKRTVSGKLNRVKKDKKIMPMRETPYGYDYDSVNGTLIINQYESEFVKMIYQWYVYDNLTMREIGEELHRLGAVPKRRESLNWGASSIRRVLTSEVYIGNFYFNRRKSQKVKGEKTISGKPKKSYEWRDPSEWIRIDVPAIIDKGLFELAQKQKVKNQKSSKGNIKHDYLVKSMLKCGHCGRTWEATTYGGREDKETGLRKQYPVYRCRGKNPRRYGEGIEKCEPTQSIKGELLDEYVWNAVMEVILDPDTLLTDLSTETTAIDQTLKAKLQVLTTQINAKDNELERVKTLFKKGIIDELELDKEFEKISREKSELEREVKQLESQIEYQDRSAKSVETLNEITDGFRKFIEEEKEGKRVLSLEQKRHIIEMFIDEIIVEFNGNDVTLTYIGILDELKKAKASKRIDVDLCSQHQEI